jgi:hypothetical protein
MYNKDFADKLYRSIYNMGLLSERNAKLLYISDLSHAFVEWMHQPQLKSCPGIKLAYIGGIKLN